MRKYTGLLFNASGTPQANTQVQVVSSGTSNLAFIYNQDGKPTSNPLTTDNNGQFAFRVISGVYDFLDITGLPLETGVQIFDFLNPGE